MFSIGELTIWVGELTTCIWLLARWPHVGDFDCRQLCLSVTLPDNIKICWCVVHWLNDDMIALAASGTITLSDQNWLGLYLSYHLNYLVIQIFVCSREGIMAMTSQYRDMKGPQYRDVKYLDDHSPRTSLFRKQLNLLEWPTCRRGGHCGQWEVDVATGQSGNSYDPTFWCSKVT